MKAFRSNLQVGQQAGDPGREPMCKFKGHKAGRANVADEVRWQSVGEFSLTWGVGREGGGLFSLQAFN